MSACATSGRVLGIDVGYSATRRTTGLCLLSWDEAVVDWRCALAGSDEASRAAALERLLGGSKRIDAVAIDGPLRPGLSVVATYRAPECMLSRGRFQRRGKPGPTNGGSGPRLHGAATELARLCLARLHVRAAGSHPRVCDTAIVEAFPNLFLGVLCPEAEYPDAARVRRRWTDALIPRVRGRLGELLAALLPGRRIAGDLALRGHEAIAAWSCALTATCIAAGRFVAVGSEDDGFIVLPPLGFWGASASGAAAWASLELERTLPGALRLFPRARRWVEG